MLQMTITFLSLQIKRLAPESVLRDDSMLTARACVHCISKVENSVGWSLKGLLSQERRSIRWYQ